MNLILPILCGVLIIAGFVALYLSRDTWPLYQIILVFFVLLANVAFLYLAARTLYIHREWRGEVAKYEQAYAKEYGLFKQLTGELDGRNEVVVDRQEKIKREITWTLDDWKAELAEVLYGRGRVLAFPSSQTDPATGVIRAQLAEPTTLPKDSSVYVFQSQPPRERKLLYKRENVTIMTPPIVRFVGAYIVSNVEKMIDLVPVNPDLKINVAGPLVIYEVAPADSHEAFAHVSEAEIKSLFPAVVPPEVVQEYLRDGKPADPQKDPPERIWRRVQFTKTHTVKDPEAKAGAPAVAPAPAGDADAAAEPGAPLAAGELKFEPEDQALFDPATAKELVVEAGVAQYVQDNPEEGIYSHVYVRPLNDYPAAFRDIRGRLIATNVKTAELDRQLQATDKSIKLATQTEQLRKQEGERLKTDLAGFTFEAATIKKLHDALVERVQEAVRQIASLKQSIAGQASQLVRLQLQAAQAIDRQPTTAARPR